MNLVRKEAWTVCVTETTPASVCVRGWPRLAPLRAIDIMSCACGWHRAYSCSMDRVQSGRCGTSPGEFAS